MNCFFFYIHFTCVIQTKKTHSNTANVCLIICQGQWPSSSLLSIFILFYHFAKCGGLFFLFAKFILCVISLFFVITKVLQQVGIWIRRMSNELIKGFFFQKKKVFLVKYSTRQVSLNIMDQCYVINIFF